MPEFRFILEACDLTQTLHMHQKLPKIQNYPVLSQYLYPVIVEVGSKVKGGAATQSRKWKSINHLSRIQTALKCYAKEKG